MGYGNAFHAECLVALLAIEVDMHIVVFVYVSAHAQFIANAVASVLYYMHQMVFLEQREGAEDARLVNSKNLVFKS